MKFKVKKKSAAQRRLALRDAMWPGVDKLVWTRHTDDGYSTVPRTLPLIMTLINLLEGNADASRVYGELWGDVPVAVEFGRAQRRQIVPRFILTDQRERLTLKQWPLGGYQHSAPPPQDRS